MLEGESQSALLLGYKGSGKSLVLDRVLRSLGEEAKDREGGKQNKPLTAVASGGKLGGAADAVTGVPCSSILAKRHSPVCYRGGGGCFTGVPVASCYVGCVFHGHKSLYVFPRL